MLGTIGADNA